MKVEVKKVDAIKRELKFEVPRDRVTKALDDVYTEIGKVAKVRGFRPGKVPRNILENSHRQIAQEEMIKHLIPEVYHEGITQENILPIDMPEIHDVNLKDGVLTFTAKLDIRPEIVLKTYKGLAIKRKSSKVTDDEVAKTLEFFKKGQGKDAETTLDDAFARSMGFPNLEEFKKSLTRQLEIDKDRQNRMDVEGQVIEQLLKSAKLMVPQSMARRQLEYRLSEARKHYKSHGMSDEEIAKKEEELNKQLPEIVERDVKIYLIFQEIAKLENITVGENESLTAKVMEFLLKEAKWEEEKEKAKD